MQVFKCEINNPNGKINHNVHCDWDDQGNLHFCEHDLGEGVKEFWGTDEYEYFNEDGDGLYPITVQIVGKGSLYDPTNERVRT